MFLQPGPSSMARAAFCRALCTQEVAPGQSMLQWLTLI